MVRCYMDAVADTTVVQTINKTSPIGQTQTNRRPFLQTVIDVDYVDDVQQRKAPFYKTVIKSWDDHARNILGQCYAQQ